MCPSPPAQIVIGFEQTSYTFSESDVWRTVTVVASRKNLKNTFASVVGGMFNILNCFKNTENTVHLYTIHSRKISMLYSSALQSSSVQFIVYKTVTNEK